MSSPPAAVFARPLYGPSDPRHSAPGDDVVAVKRGLWRADLFAGPASSFDRDYNPKAVEAVRELQKRAGIQATGNYGLASHEALRRTQPLAHPGEWAFDATALDLLKAEAKLLAVTPEQRAKHAGVDAANYWILHRDESDYAQVRPFPIIRPPKIARRVDCSGFVTEVYYAAGAPDPNGRGYDGEGYTGTLVGRGRQVDVHAVDLLDLVFYGFTTRPTPAFPYGSPTHVAVYIGGGYVASDGSQAGPEKRELWYRGSAASGAAPSGLHSVRRYPLV